VGTYTYNYTFCNADYAESPCSANTQITTNSSNKQVNLSNIQTGPAGTAARKIYRSLVGGSVGYFLTQISDNSTTTFTDNIGDGSLTSAETQVFAGGGILFDSNASAQQGYIGQSTSNSGTVRIHGNGRVELTYNSAEPSKKYWFDSTGFNIWFGCQSTISPIIVGCALGVKNNSGTKLFEIKTNGNCCIAGTQYQTSAGSIATAASQSFDSFDMAETFEVDKEYPPGTVLCPADTNSTIPYTIEPGAHRNQPKLSQCTHDCCSLALVSVANPGFLAGLINLPAQEDYNEKNPLTMACSMTGRVFVRTAYQIAGRSYICSDGRGGVRPMTKGESGMALGVSLAPTVNGKLPILIRPTFVSL
jgi:hypothetical protein